LKDAQKHIKSRKSTQRKSTKLAKKPYFSKFKKNVQNSSKNKTKSKRNKLSHRDKKQKIARLKRNYSNTGYLSNR
jgi:hypothetical protein